ncbi:hypothetical protein AYI70_g3062 [Smittium culicis]|uniref:Uncharacterized protein n=1 Tax=Smittium culicis TaxID=133412 RepID=A0A1R1Y5L7_9FUNG|nr:hypothetical protein AYI70_g3062 [Smittium culicis]
MPITRLQGTPPSEEEVSNWILVGSVEQNSVLFGTDSIPFIVRNGFLFQSAGAELTLGLPVYFKRKFIAFTCGIKKFPRTCGQFS